MLAKYWEKRRRQCGLWLDYRRRELRALSPASRRERATDPRPLVSMRQLGRLGRFGNWIFQYMFLKCFAAKHGLQVQTPHWPGHELFACNDPLISTQLPSLADSEADELAVSLLERPEVVSSVNLEGYFQDHTRIYAPYKTYIRALLAPNPQLRQTLQCGMQRFNPTGRTLVALHIRRGDFGEDQFYITPTEWYRKLLEKLWPTLDNPLLYIATDEPDKIVADFADYHPRTASDLGVRIPQAPYFADFFVLTQADILAIPNSTFSFVAAMLNDIETVYRSHLSDPLESPPFRRIDPWNSDPLDREARVERFPNVAGIRREE